MIWCQDAVECAQESKATDFSCRVRHRLSHSGSTKTTSGTFFLYNGLKVVFELIFKRKTLISRSIEERSGAKMQWNVFMQSDFSCKVRHRLSHSRATKSNSGT